MNLKLYRRRPSLMRICLVTGMILGATLVCTGLYLALSGKSVAGESVLFFYVGLILEALTALAFILYIDYRDNAPFLG